jgi:hypothetical protein
MNNSCIEVKEAKGNAVDGMYFDQYFHDIV